LQNFTKLGQSAAELWPKTIFKMAAIRRLELKKFMFGYLTVIEF